MVFMIEQKCELTAQEIFEDIHANSTKTDMDYAQGILSAICLSVGVPGK